MTKVWYLLAGAHEDSEAYVDDYNVFERSVLDGEWITVHPTHKPQKSRWLDGTYVMTFGLAEPDPN